MSRLGHLSGEFLPGPFRGFYVRIGSRACDGPPRRRFLAGLLVLLVLVASQGCGGGGRSTEGTPTAGLTPVGTAAPTAVATAVIEDHTIRSPLGYRATFPDGWQAIPNFASAPGASQDAFFSPVEAGEEQAKPNIAVTCRPGLRGQDVASFADDSIKALEQLGRQMDTAAETISVAGVDAVRVEYSLTFQTTALEKIDVLLVAGPCAWTLSLTAPKGERETYRPAFDDFVNSFQVMEVSTPEG